MIGSAARTSPMLSGNIRICSTLVIEVEDEGVKVILDVEEGEADEVLQTSIKLPAVGCNSS